MPALKQVLIVEPEMTLHPLFRMILNNRFQYVIVVNRDLALTILTRRSYDAVVTNLVPEEGFAGFAKTARSLQPCIKIVLTSAYPNAGSTPGIDAFVEKEAQKIRALPQVIEGLFAGT